MTNEVMAKTLQQYALELEKAGDNLFRARAFRTAAGQLLMMSRPIQEVFEEEGRMGLARLPGIGKSLAYAIERLIRTGEVQPLRPLSAMHEPDQHLRSLPGVGLRTAEDLRDRLGITSLEGVREAVLQGRLAEIGITPRRQEALLEEVDRRLALKRRPRQAENEPEVAFLLGIDAQFGRRGERNRAEQEGWLLRAQHANTALAHRLGKTHDWVVVTFFKEGHSGQRTIVTESQGDLTGKRVVRGRENECRLYYQRQEQPVEAEPAA